MCDVEEQVQKLIEVLSLTLRCGGLSRDPKTFAANVQRALYIALRNATYGPEHDNIGRMNDTSATSRGTQMNFMPIFTPFLRGSPGNGSSGMMSQDSLNYSIPLLTPGQDGMSDETPVFRLHRLEIIKVVVLIIVISIILLTTCRMVFQLFLRFRPEKTT